MKIVDIVPLCNKEECIDKYNGTFRFLPDFIPANEYTVCEYKIEQNGYKNEYQCAEKALIYFDGDFADYFKVGKGYYYGICDGENDYDFYIEEIDKYEKCIVVFKGCQDYSKLNVENCKITFKFDKDKLPDFEKLYEFGFDSFPSFHETHISYFERLDKNIKFVVEGGFSPLKTTFEITGIKDFHIQSTDTDDLFSYFQRNYRIGEIQIYTSKDDYKVVIEDNYTSGSYDDNGDLVEASHTNMLEIICKELSIDFQKNDELVIQKNERIIYRVNNMQFGIAHSLMRNMTLSEKQKFINYELENSDLRTVYVFLMYLISADDNEKEWHKFCYEYLVKHNSIIDNSEKLAKWHLQKAIE